MDKKLNTENITPELIKHIVNKIVKTIKPEKVILYGSYANDNFSKHSDLDLLIVKEDKKSNREIRRKVDALLRGRRFSVDLTVRKPKEIEWNFRAHNTFYIDHIFRNGKILYEKKP